MWWGCVEDTVMWQHTRALPGGESIQGHWDKHKGLWMVSSKITKSDSYLLVLWPSCKPLPFTISYTDWLIYKREYEKRNRISLLRKSYSTGFPSQALSLAHLIREKSASMIWGTLREVLGQQTARNSCSQFKKGQTWARDIVQWYSACLACIRP